MSAINRAEEQDDERGRLDEVKNNQMCIPGMYLRNIVKLPVVYVM